MRLVTSVQMTALDRAAQEDFHIPGLLLMEQAARKALQALEELVGSCRGQDVLIYAGPGNNGGDGFALARMLQAAGALPRVVLVASRARLRGDAATNFACLEPLGIPVASGWEAPRDSDLVVDALLGTGAALPLRGGILEAVEGLATFSGPVLALDIPTGVPVEGGAPAGPCVQATRTVTFGFPKGFAVCPVARPWAGDVIVASIGIPMALRRTMSEAEYALVADSSHPPFSLPSRPTAGHKGTFGKVLVVGGASGMGGAAILSARGVLRAGAGMVRILGGKGLRSEFGGSLPEAMIEEWGDGDSIVALDGALSWADAVVLGPGLGQDAFAQELASRVLEKFAGPVVVDADGLDALPVDRSPGGYRVLTPHPGEAARLLGVSVGPGAPARREAARRLQARFQADVVLKGAFTLLEGRGGCLVNTTGSPGLAVAGSGDVLAGLLGGLLAHRAPPGDAPERSWERSTELVAIGIWAHGLAGCESGVKQGRLARELADRAGRVLAQVASGGLPTGAGPWSLATI